jgi:nitroreductase
VRETTASEPAEALLSLIRTRKAVRAYAEGSVPREHLQTILLAARLASSGGNNRLQRFLVVQEPRRVRLVQSVSPGMLALPPAIVLICTDATVCEARGIQLGRDYTTWVDVGTAAMNMQLMAHALRLGSCPVTSISPRGLQAVLELPETALPELLLMVGRLPGSEPAPPIELPKRPSLEGFAFWERYGEPILTPGGGGAERSLGVDGR